MFEDRLSALSQIAFDRADWHRSATYLPPVYAILTDDEFALLMAWYDATQKAGLIGECGIPALSMLQSLIMGNGIKRIVQAGHYSGYSTLMIGMMLRRMGIRNGLISLDIDQVSTAFAQSWVERAGLTDYVRLVLADSADPLAPDIACHHLDGRPQLVFIDSSHQYRHTTEELKIWVPVIDSQGFVCMHDVSEWASSSDTTERGGTRRALLEWRGANGGESLMLCGSTPGAPTPYLDPCGLGILQIPQREFADPVNKVAVSENRRRLVRDPTFNLKDSWWSIGREWTIGSGAAVKELAGLRPLCVHSPIRKGEKYDFDVVVDDIRSGSFHVDCGGSGPPIEGPLVEVGRHRVTVVANGDNPLISIVPTPDFVGRISKIYAQQIS